MTGRSKFLLVILSLFSMMLMSSFHANAHNTGTLSFTLNGVGPSNLVYMQHKDEADSSGVWAGWVSLSVTNNGTESWGDFHFKVKEVQNFGSVENIDWQTAPPYAPGSSQSGLTWNVNNDIVGATIDLFFYSDPVAPGKTATFSVYNVNPDQRAFFGVEFYPTPVPVPGAAWLLGSGLLGLLGLRKRS